MKRILYTTLLCGALLQVSLAQNTNTQPVLVCPESVIGECSAPDGTPAVLTASVTDVEGDALSVTWYLNGIAYQTNEVAAVESTNVVSVTFEPLVALGTNEIVITVSDGQTEAVSCSSELVVQDTVPPVINSIAVTPNVLWPPNHSMRQVSVQIDASDDCGPVNAYISSIVSNEPLNGLGDGNTPIDYTWTTGELTAFVRAERAGRGSGRTYTITVEAVDFSGNSVSQGVTVFVPHDQSQKVKKAHPVKPVKTPAKPAKPAKGKPAKPVKGKK
jgi:hypothetical protein